ncbi:MAG: hypothetical protein QM690_00865 [Sphingobium sp.]
MRPFRRTLTGLLLLPPIALLPSPAFAGIGGGWHVTGEIAGRKFTADCRFDPQGTAQFGGECIALSTGEETVKAGKSYKLTQGSVSGNQVRWGYPTKVMFLSVDIQYAGTLSGDRINGTISAAGRKGTFAAVRK